MGEGAGGQSKDAAGASWVLGGARHLGNSVLQCSSLFFDLRYVGFSYFNEITSWNQAKAGEGKGLMGNSQGRDNVKKRASRRKKTERLALAKAGTAKRAEKAKKVAAVRAVISARVPPLKMS